MAKSMIPADLWDPTCPICNADLDLDDGNGKLECRNCGWGEKQSKKSVCGNCSSEIELSEAYYNGGFCASCNKKLRRKLK